MKHIGIDCGGTSTDFVLSDGSLNVIATLRRPSVHMTQVPKETMAETLLEGVKALLETSNTKVEKLSTITIGMAGYGESGFVQKAMDEAIDNVFEKPFPKPMVFNDAIVAHAGALKGKDGALLIAGTGSIGILKEEGVYKRTGGWGPTIGDEGSGYWIGKELLNRFSKMADGRLDKTPLYHRLKTYLELENDYDLIARMHRFKTLSRTDIAALSEWIGAQAREGDPICLKLYEEAAEHLSECVNALVANAEKETIPLALVGGVFKSEGIIMAPLRRHLDRRFEIQSPKATPALGAVIQGMNERNGA